MLAAESCLLTDIVDHLHESAKKVNSVERLTRHLNKGIPADAQRSYLSLVRKWASSEPVIHIVVLCQEKVQVKSELFS